MPVRSLKAYAAGRWCQPVIICAVAVVRGPTRRGVGVDLAGPVLVEAVATWSSSLVSSAV
jgi:hypothetical protein